MNLFVHGSRCVDERIIKIIHMLTNEIALKYDDAKKFSSLLDDILLVLENNFFEEDIEWK